MHNLLLDFPFGISCPLARPVAQYALPQRRQGTFAPHPFRASRRQKRRRRAASSLQVKRGAARKKTIHFILKRILPANPAMTLGVDPRTRTYDVPPSIRLLTTTLGEVTLSDRVWAQILDFAKTHLG